jgi:hypothetical protein
MKDKTTRFVRSVVTTGLLSLLPLTFASSTLAAPGDLDTTFSGDGKVTTNFGSGRFDVVNGIALQANGKTVVAGKSDNGTNSDFALARYNVNGSLATNVVNRQKVERTQSGS